MRFARAVIGAPDRVEILFQRMHFENGANAAMRLAGGHGDEPALIGETVQRLDRAIIKRFLEIGV